MWAFSADSSAGSVTVQNASRRPTFSFPLSLYTGALMARRSPWVGPFGPRSTTLISGVLAKTVRVLRPSLPLCLSALSGEADTPLKTPIMPSASTPYQRHQEDRPSCAQHHFSLFLLL